MLNINDLIHTLYTNSENINNFISNNFAYTIKNNNVNTGVIMFRKILENIQEKISTNDPCKLFSTNVLSSYVTNFTTLGKCYSGICGEVACSIMLLNNTELVNCSIQMQQLIMQTFFPVETFIASTNINKHKLNSENIYTAEQAANNVLKLIKKLKKYATLYKYLKVKNNKLRLHNIEHIIKYNITNARKLADIAKNKINTHTYNKLKYVE